MKLITVTGTNRRPYKINPGNIETIARVLCGIGMETAPEQTIITMVGQKPYYCDETPEEIEKMIAEATQL